MSGKLRPVTFGGASQATVATFLPCNFEFTSSDNADEETELDSSEDDATSYVSEVRSELMFSSEKELASALHKAGIDMQTWGEKSAKSIRDLFWEILKRECRMEWNGNRLERYVKVLSVLIHVDTPFGPRVLMERFQQIGSHKRDLSEAGRYVTKMFYFGEDEDEVTHQALALHNVCGLATKTQQRYLKFVRRTMRTEGPRSSFGYPGLMTHYVIIERHLKITDPEGEGLQVLGLPLCLNFTYDEEAVPLWRRHFWTWKECEPARPNSSTVICATKCSVPYVPKSFETMDSFSRSPFDLRAISSEFVPLHDGKDSPCVHPHGSWFGCCQ